MNVNPLRRCGNDGKCSKKELSSNYRIVMPCALEKLEYDYNAHENGVITMKCDQQGERIIKCD